MAGMRNTQPRSPISSIQFRRFSVMKRLRRCYAPELSGFDLYGSQALLAEALVEGWGFMDSALRHISRFKSRGIGASRSTASRAISDTGNSPTIWAPRGRAEVMINHR